MQNQESGATAAQWGRKTGPKLARYFGGIQIKPNTNVFLIKGVQVAIKAARMPNRRIVVYNSVRDRVDLIRGAFQTGDTFKIFEITPSTWIKYARLATSGDRTSLNITEFEKHGHLVATVKIDDIGNS